MSAVHFLTNFRDALNLQFPSLGVKIDTPDVNDPQSDNSLILSAVSFDPEIDYKDGNLAAMLDWTLTVRNRFTDADKLTGGYPLAIDNAAQILLWLRNNLAIYYQELPITADSDPNAYALVSRAASEWVYSTDGESKPDLGKVSIRITGQALIFYPGPDDIFSEPAPFVPPLQSIITTDLDTGDMRDVFRDQMGG